MTQPGSKHPALRRPDSRGGDLCPPPASPLGGRAPNATLSLGFQGPQSRPSRAEPGGAGIREKPAAGDSSGSASLPSPVRGEKGKERGCGASRDKRYLRPAPQGPAAPEPRTLLPGSSCLGEAGDRRREPQAPPPPSPAPTALAHVDRATSGTPRVTKQQIPPASARVPSFRFPFGGEREAPPRFPRVGLVERERWSPPIGAGEVCPRDAREPLFRSAAGFPPAARFCLQ